MARAAGQLPTVLLLVGDYLAGVDDLPQPRWRKELIRLWSVWNRRGQDRAARRSLTFVNSRRLYTKYQPIAVRLVETRTTTLSQEDFYEREDTCLSPPYHLLYTGRMDRLKGILVLVEALAILAAQGENLVLDLVGWPEKGDPVLEDLANLARLRGVGERVIYHGFRPVGPELFQFYRQADLYVLASTSSFEGFPRTIWEAMAHSLPVVATRVGSIPDYIAGAAELVQPGDAGALANGIRNMLHDPQQRKVRIRNGLALARENTLEKQTQKMIAEIEAWITAL
jgi:glycosyltransferase involved in cell wall biosynthesis